jgi:phosphoribosylanthranilate isomerase
VLIKICGITNDDDAQAAARLGAAALGFVFWPKSPRAVTPESAAGIVANLPPFVSTVGVFVDETPARVAEIVRIVGLDVVQLHGDEALSAYEGVARRLIKAMPATPSLEATIDRWPRHVPLLLDAADRERRGGTGRAIDWALASRIAVRTRVVLAGGLTPDNLGEAVRQVRPWAVDLSSGVERTPGVKDHARLRALFAAAAALDAELVAESPRQQGREQ